MSGDVKKSLTRGKLHKMVRKPFAWFADRSIKKRITPVNDVFKYSYDNKSFLMSELLDMPAQEIRHALASQSLLELYEFAKFIIDDCNHLANKYHQLKLQHAIRRHLQRQQFLLKIVKNMFSERLQNSHTYPHIKVDARAYNKVRQLPLLKRLIEACRSLFINESERNFKIFMAHLQYQNAMVLSVINKANRNVEGLACEHLASGEALPQNITEFSHGRQIESVDINPTKTTYQLKVKFSDADIIELYEVDKTTIEKCAYLRYQKIQQVLLKLKGLVSEHPEESDISMNDIARIANRFLDLQGRERIASILGISIINIANCAIKYDGSFILEIRRRDSAITGVGTECYTLTRAQIEDFILERYQVNKALDQQFKQ